MKSLEDIVDFANLVFNLKGEGINFAELLPKAYSQERADRLKHHIIEENGKIRALIDLYPLELKQDDCMLKAAYAGTVSVHPNSRHRGYMTKLMKQAEESARASGCDLMILDGNRHRYQHYGFERAGIKYNYNITRDSIRHCCQNLYGNTFADCRQYRFEILDEQTQDYAAIIDKLYELYSRRHVRARSKEDFWLCLQSWGGRVYTVYRKQTEMSHSQNGCGEGSYTYLPEGYISTSYDERNIFEFELTDTSMLPKIIYEFANELDNDETGITIGADETDKMNILDKMSDYYNIGMSHQIKLLNHRNTLEFLLKWKSKYTQLTPGEYTITINETCETYHITVKNQDTPQEIKVETAPIPPDLTLQTSQELVTLLTTPLYYQTPHSQNKLNPIPFNWFPLPFYLPDPDAF